jgi:hypothetical protein
VRALLTSSPSYHRLRPIDRKRLAHGLVKVAAYAAECVRDDWYQSQRLGQRPLVVRREYAAPAVATAQADQRPGADFTPGAAQKIGRVTRETLNAISFPTFVSELIRGTFNAITDASIKQMEAYGRLLGDVGRTVDDFMNQSISDNQARDWLVEQYPGFLRIDRSTGSTSQPARRGGRERPARADRGKAEEPQATIAPVEGAEDRPLPNWRADLGVAGQPSLDAAWLEDKLVPAARRKLAQSRLQTLSTLVLMGMNRITVTGGKLRATMAFHIDTSDIAREEHATETDVRAAAAGSVGFAAWSASASASFAYVSSSRRAAESEMNVAADLTSEVEIHFRSDPFPLERMAPPTAIGRIVANTPVPETNTPTASSGDAIPWGAPVERAAVPQRNRPAWGHTPAGSPIGAAPQPAAPAAQPTQPAQPAKPETAAGAGGAVTGGDAASAGDATKTASAGDATKTASGGDATKTASAGDATKTASGGDASKAATEGPS